MHQYSNRVALFVALGAAAGAVSVWSAVSHFQSPEIGARPADAAPADSVQVEVLSALTNVAETQVRVRIAGSTDLGGTASLAMGATLTLGNAGRPIPSLGRESSGREILIRFPRLDADGQVFLDLNGITLGGPAADSRPSGTLVGSRRVSAQVRTSESTAIAAPHSAPLGVSEWIDVTEIVKDDTYIVVRGRVRGMSFDEAPVVDLWPTSLVDGGGRPFSLAFGRSGFGPGRNQFEFAFFNDGSDGQLEFRVSTAVDTVTALRPGDPLARFSDASASIAFTVAN